MYMARKEVLTRAFQNIGHLFQKWQNIHIYRAARVHRKPTLSLPQEKTKTRTVKSAEAAFMMTKKKKKREMFISTQQQQVTPHVYEDV